MLLLLLSKVAPARIFCVYKKGTTAREVLQGDSIVDELTEGDTGIESPNAVNHYQLRKVGLTSYASVVHKLGYAYFWAQKVCGLDFLNTDVGFTVSVFGFQL